MQHKNHQLLWEQKVANLLTILKYLNLSCRIPDDCIDSKRHPLFMAREAMAEFVAELKASRKDAT